MSLVDANLLLYAEDKGSPQNNKCRDWWDAQLSGDNPVGLCWPVLNAFIRIGTNQRVFEHPLTIEEAINRIQSWLEQPPCSAPKPHRETLANISRNAYRRPIHRQPGTRRPPCNLSY